MSVIAKTVVCAVLVGFAACKQSQTAANNPNKQPPPTPPPAETSPEVTVQLSSLHLGDNCGNANAAAAKGEALAADALAAGRCAGPNCGRPCRQSRMQLVFSASDIKQPMKVKIEKVEIVDAQGAVKDTLSARKATMWKNSSYVDWDEMISADGTIRSGYHLSAPNWSNIPGGRYGNEISKMQLKVTVMVGGMRKTANLAIVMPIDAPVVT